MAIIFIPGIKATALSNINSFDYNLMYNNYDTLGGAISSTALGVRFDEQLQLNPKYDYSSGTIIERNHIMTYPYKNSMNDINDYTGELIYLFGYDWRKSNVDNAVELSRFIENLKGKLGETSFSFITHSMGAMIMGCYLKSLNENYSIIKKIVYTAPPFRGGLEAIKHMALGNGGLRGFLNMDEGSRKAIRTYPAIYELAPWYNGAVTNAAGDKSLDLTAQGHWQTSIWDDLTELFDNRIQSMKDFRDNQFMDLNTLPAELKSRIIIVAGKGSDTMQSVKLLPDPEKADILYFDFKGGDHSDDGDSTVPLSSSTIYKDTIKTFVVDRGSLFHEGLTTVSYHALFLTHSKVLNIVKRFLKGNTQDNDWFKSIGDDVKLA